MKDTTTTAAAAATTPDNNDDCMDNYSYDDMYCDLDLGYGDEQSYHYDGEESIKVNTCLAIPNNGNIVTLKKMLQHLGCRLSV
jgi:hypothetical protein